MIHTSYAWGDVISNSRSQQWTPVIKSAMVEQKRMLEFHKVLVKDTSLGVFRQKIRAIFVRHAQLIVRKGVEHYDWNFQDGFSPGADGKDLELGAEDFPRLLRIVNALAAHRKNRNEVKSAIARLQSLAAASHDGVSGSSLETNIRRVILVLQDVRIHSVLLLHGAPDLDIRRL
jgi:hypothetical protein